MIISHKNKFIFIKTSKTASTSIEIALSKYCGPDDIITPISGEDERIRNAFGFPGPQNYLLPHHDNSNQKKADYKFFNHISAVQILELLGKRVWNAYYKFCVARNPWDRVISSYYWHHRNKPLTPISEFIKSNAPFKLKRNGYDLYTINGKVAVDKICSFEKLQEDLEFVRKQVGLPEKLVLPRAKSGYREVGSNYRDLLSEEDKKLIADLFQEEITLFDYRF